MKVELLDFDWSFTRISRFVQYFHPDNMSSADKLKIELAKVREEFKMSESDCGSARVQGKSFFSPFVFASNLTDMRPGGC